MIPIRTATKKGGHRESGHFSIIYKPMTFTGMDYHILLWHHQGTRLVLGTLGSRLVQELTLDIHWVLGSLEGNLRKRKPKNKQ